MARRTAPTPSPAVEADTRERLLEAAGAEFAAHGFARTTVRAICQAAGANVAAVSYHFGDKEGLYRAVLQAAFARKEQAAPLTAAPDAPLAVRVLAFAEVFLRRLLSEGPTWHARIMAWEMVEPTGALREVVETHFRPVRDLLEGFVGEARPDLDQRARRLHAHSLMGQITFYRHAAPALAHLESPLTPAALPGLARHITAVFLRGLERADLLAEIP